MKKLYITFLVLVLALAMIVPVGVVNAGSGQIAVSGEVAFYFAGIELDKTVGENGVMMGTLEHYVVYTGDIEGTAEESLNFRLNPNTGEFPNYKVNDEGTQVFTGTVLGKAGTFTAHVRHQMRLDGSGKIEQTITSGTGDLANLHGTLIIIVYRQLDGSYAGTYSGKVHFAP
jgi:hypothetical protein